VGTEPRARTRVKRVSTNLRTTRRRRVTIPLDCEAARRAMASPMQSPKADPILAIAITETVVARSDVEEEEIVALARQITIAEDVLARLLKSTHNYNTRYRST
jgi:hypothetical protein